MSKKNLDPKELIKKLQLKMLRIQQCVWNTKDRVIIVFEGFDAAGKGGAIRKLTETLDPRGYRVHPIGPPNENEQGKHYLYRFWVNLPSKGIISIFDRSWYGRVLVERVEDLIPKKRWKEAYAEINQFEKTLTNDGIALIKIFIRISKDEQFRRFEERLNDPYKLWKITEADIRGRKKWNSYSRAVKDMLLETSTTESPWYVIEGDDKESAREEVLKIVTEQLNSRAKWTENKAHKHATKSLKRELVKLK